MGRYEDDLRLILKPEFDAGRIREAGDAVGVFDLLSTAYPASGSKIDWTQVPGSIGAAEKDRTLQIERFLEFFDDICSRFDLAGPVFYAADSLTDWALEGTIETIRRALPELLSIPQHHYLIGPNARWCMCMTFEGDMDFGRLAAAPIH